MVSGLFGTWRRGRYLSKHIMLRVFGIILQHVEIQSIFLFPKLPEFLSEFRSLDGARNIRDVREISTFGRIM